MNMHGDLSNINKILRNDSDLWKLLYYKSKHANDDPLNKPDILSLPLKEKNEIINHRLKHTPVTSDLVNDETKGICRIIFFPAPRKPQRGNYAVADQEVDIEIFVHHSYNDTDMRLAKLCDRVNELLSHKPIAGLGKAEFTGGRPFIMSDVGYIGYRMTYRFGSVNAK